MKWFKNIGTKIKIFFGAVFSVLAFILFIFVRSKITAKQKLEYELERLRLEMKEEELKADAEDSKERLSGLKEKEEEIRRKIEEVEEREYKGEEVSVGEIDEFFKDRGLL